MGGLRELFVLKQKENENEIENENKNNKYEIVHKDSIHMD